MRVNPQNMIRQHSGAQYAPEEGGFRQLKCFWKKGEEVSPTKTTCND